VGASCYELGLLYETGSGYPRDLVKALALYEQACTDKHPPACEKVKRLRH
jgi:TPR repeat protein